jgi:acyl-coenzyme A synthetase/AMP-(fatty) acid ligase
MSPRNSAAAVISMMEKTKCHRLITTHSSLGPLIDGVKADFVSHDTETGQLQINEILALKDLYPDLIRGSPNGEFVPYPLPASRSSQDDILVYIHSSGSTGFPKPIPITNLSIIHWCTTRKSL